MFHLNLGGPDVRIVLGATSLEGLHNERDTCGLDLKKWV
jgi:hypothetical protein